MAGTSRAERHPLGAFDASTFEPHNSFERVEGRLGLQDRIAIAITNALGSMYAVYVLLAWTAVWIVVQVALGTHAFDPYPFAFLLLLGDVVQLVLIPLVLVGQRLQARQAEAMAKEEYETVRRIFHDLNATLEHLDAQDRELVRQTRLLITVVESLLPPERRAAILDATVDSPLSGRV